MGYQFVTFYVKFKVDGEIKFDSFGFCSNRREAWEKARAKHGDHLEPIAIEMSDSESKILKEWVETKPQEFPYTTKHKQ